MSLGVRVRDTVRYRGLRLLVFEHVYPPSDDSFLLAEHQGVARGDRVLDVGTGCGIQALVAADRGCEVTAVDVNPAAVLCTRWNARLNGLRVRALEGDLFEPVEGERFDVVLFNPPYLPAGELPRDDPLSAATEDPTVIERFLRGLADRRVEWEEARIVVSTLTPEEHLRPLDRFEVETVARRRLFFEELKVLALRP